MNRNKTMTDTSGISIPMLHPFFTPFSQLQSSGKTVIKSLRPQLLPNRHEDRSSHVFVTRCENVRLNGESLRPAPLPGKIPVMKSGQSMRLMAVMHHSILGRVAFYKIGNDMLAYSRLDMPVPTVRPMGVLRENFEQVIELSPDRLLIVAPDCLRHLHVDTDSLIISLPSRIEKFTPWQLRVIDSSTEIINVSGRMVSKTYDSASRVLNAVDSASLHREGIMAMSRFINSSATAGRFALAVIGRYRLLDKSGRTLYLSLPKLLAPETGFTFDSESAATLDLAGSRYDDWTISASSFRVELLPPTDISTLESDLIAEVAVELTPLIYPFDASTSASGRIRVRAGHENMRDVVFRPGGAVSVNGNDNCYGSALINHLLALGEKSFTCTTLIKEPFKAGGQPLTVHPPQSSLLPLANQIKQLQRLINSPIIPRQQLFSIPHTIGATVAGRLGSALALGNLHVNLCDAASPQYLLATQPATGDIDWHLQSIITFIDGSQLVTTAAMKASSTSLPKLSPLIFYPDSEAIKADIEFHSSAKAWGVSVDLRPTPDGAGAYFMNYGATACELRPLSSPVRLSPGTVTKHFPKALIITSPYDINSVHATSVDESSGPITDLLEVERRASAWESNRRRLYVATAGGLDGVSVANDYSAMRWERLDPRGASTTRALVATPGALYPVAASIGGDIVGIKSGTVTNILPGYAAGAIAWDAVNSELWVMTSCGLLAIPRLDRFHFHIKNLPSERLFTLADSMLSVDNDADIYDTSLPSDSATTDIAWEVDVEAPLRADRFTPAPVSAAAVALHGLSRLPRFSLAASFAPTALSADETPSVANQRILIVEASLPKRATVPTLLPSLFAPARPRVIARIAGATSEEVALTAIQLQFK